MPPDSTRLPLLRRALPPAAALWLGACAVTPPDATRLAPFNTLTVSRSSN